jgi:hypothetical protein
MQTRGQDSQEEIESNDEDFGEYGQYAIYRPRRAGRLRPSLDIEPHPRRPQPVSERATPPLFWRTLALGSLNHRLIG